MIKEKIQRKLMYKFQISTAFKTYNHNKVNLKCASINSKLQHIFSAKTTYKNIHLF